jgi:glycerophosphoryl diester phosphodiesterase
MRTLLISLLFSTILLVGCADDSSFSTSPDSEITFQTSIPNWVQLPNDLTKGMGIETEYSTSKLINGDDGGTIKLKFKIKRPGHELGDLVIKAKVKVKKHSFPENEERLFTITMDPDNAYLNITPSPNTLDKHIVVSWSIKGIDVSDINPENLNFIYVGDGNEILETSKEEIIIDPVKHKLKVKKAKIYPTSTVNTPGGSRYGFTR